MLTLIQNHDDDFWTAYPQDFEDDADFLIIGEVSADELLKYCDKAETAYCGDGGSVRTADELAALAKWLHKYGYSLKTAFQCVANVAAFHESD